MPAAGPAHRLAEGLRGAVVSRRIQVGPHAALAAEVEDVAVETGGVGTVGQPHLAKPAVNSFTPEVMGDLGNGGLERPRPVPGAEIAAVEAPTGGSGVQEGGYHYEGVGDTKDPLVVGKPGDPFLDQTVVGPALQFHDSFRIVRPRHAVEGGDRWELRRDQAVCRVRNGGRHALTRSRCRRRRRACSPRP